MVSHEPHYPDRFVLHPDAGDLYLVLSRHLADGEEVETPGATLAGWGLRCVDVIVHDVYPLRLHPVLTQLGVTCLMQTGPWLTSPSCLH